MPEDRLLLSGLSIHGGERTLVEGAGLELRPGRITVLVGASGSGKTLTARALLGLVPLRPGVVSAELELRAGGVAHHPYAALGDRRAVERAFRPLRGAAIAWLPQDARGSLDPLWTVGRQVRESLRLRRADPARCRTRSREPGGRESPIEWLERAGFADPQRAARLYPHELSGGMAQRAGIAVALARGARFLLADEPTTGLDPTIKEAILVELLALRDAGVGLLFITHDLRLVPRVADHLLVMHQGRIVEDMPAGSLDQLSSPPARALWEATARVAGGAL